jgi:lupus La protein
MAEAAKGKPEKGKQSEKPKPQIYLQFMGSKLLVHEDDEGAGTVKEEDVVHVKGATLKFEGWEGDVVYKELKV